MLISEQNLLRVTKAIVLAGGSADAEAEIVADHLVRANLTGHDSHGVGMLPAYADNLNNGYLRPNTAARLEMDSGPILRFDGGDGYGQRVAREAIDAAIARCRELGAVVMTLRNAHHVGRVGTYGEQVIDAGLVSISFVNVTDHGPLVAPFRGADARMITNPVCIAVPGTASTPATLLDMATSRIAMGKVRVALNEGRQLADGMLIDSEGQPTRDPAVMFNEPRGALLPFGEHKGYGLALACELLAGVLSGGGSIQPANQKRESIVNNMLSILIDPAKLADGNWLTTEYDAVIAYMKSSRATDPDAPVLTAGDPERASTAKRKADGIPVDDTTWSEILGAGESLGLDRVALEGLAD